MKVKANVFFLKILSSFLVVALISVLVVGAFWGTGSFHIQKSTLEMLDTQFEDGAKDVCRMLAQIRYAMSELSVKFAADADFKNGSYIEKNLLRAEMRAVLVDRRQNEFSKYLSTAFMVDTSKEEYIYELTETQSAEVFYNHFFANETYTDEFWISKTTSGELFEIYPALTYTTVRDAKRIDMKLMPVSYKPKDKSEYLLVALFDIEAMANDFGISGLYLSDGKMVFASEVLSEVKSRAGEISEGKVKGGNVFKYTDELNGNIELYDFVSDSEFIGENKNIGGVAIALFVAFVLIVVVASVFFAFRISKIFSLASDELMSNASVKTKFPKGIFCGADFVDALKLISLSERRPSSDGGPKDSVLDSMILQAQMRDVYVGINDIEEKINYEDGFSVIYFKVSYMKELTNYMDDEGKATFLLKQLIEMYLETWNVSSVTFQTEKRGIVSVFDAAGVSDPKEILEKLIIKLSNESEYAYFTIVVSEIHDSNDNVKGVYEKLVEISKYGRLVTETQVLCEGKVSKDVSRFYFSVEEMGKLSVVIQNGTEEDVIRKVDEILEYNRRKDINRFEMYLLCTEIVNCAVKVVNRVFYEMPQVFDISSVYRNLEKAETPLEYRETCISFLHEIIEYIKKNKREDDYIISYILDYVEKHYSEDIYLNLFAEKLKLTGAYISSYFKEKMNVNLTDYINNYRIKKAVVLSENPQNKNKDIAELVGLPNINTFIRLFKKYTGYTPGEYRKKHFGEDGNK